MHIAPSPLVALAMNYKREARTETDPQAHFDQRKQHKKKRGILNQGEKHSRKK